MSLAVEDDGEGIAPDVVERLFDPFFSTRFIGRGLGLPSIVGMLRSHDAAVSLDTLPGTGSTFTLFFPVSGTPES